MCGVCAAGVVSSSPGILSALGLGAGAITAKKVLTPKRKSKSKRKSKGKRKSRGKRKSKKSSKK